MTKLTAQASIQIQKTAAVVFNAIINANEMSQYFIEKSSGNLIENSEVTWKFPEFPDLFPVKGLRIIKDEYISFDWSGGIENMKVEIFLFPQEDDSTVMKIIEHEMEKSEEGIVQMMRQTEGWANFLACLKANLEYGINLRKGAFEFMKKQH